MRSFNLIHCVLTRTRQDLSVVCIVDALYLMDYWSPRLNGTGHQEGLLELSSHIVRMMEDARTKGNASRKRYHPRTPQWLVWILERRKAWPVTVLRDVTEHSSRCFKRLSTRSRDCRRFWLRLKTARRAGWLPGNRNQEPSVRQAGLWRHREPTDSSSCGWRSLVPLVETREAKEGGCSFHFRNLPI